MIIKIERKARWMKVTKDSIEFEAHDKITVVIPASLGVPKINFEIGFNGKLIIKGDKSLIEFRKSFY